MMAMNITEIRVSLQIYDLGTSAQTLGAHLKMAAANIPESRVSLHDNNNNNDNDNYNDNNNHTNTTTTTNNNTNTNNHDTNKSRLGTSARTLGALSLQGRRSEAETRM